MESLAGAETQRDSCILSSLFLPSTRLGAAKPLWVLDGSAIGVNAFIIQVKGTKLEIGGERTLEQTIGIYEGHSLIYSKSPREPYCTYLIFV